MKKVLIVHRGAKFTHNVRAVLENAGFAAEIARCGDQALASFHRGAPSAVILDMSDERLDGIRLMQKLRTNSTVPVILLSESAEEVDEIMGLRLGADTVLRQPLSAHLLLEWVKSLIKRHQALVETSGDTEAAGRSLHVGSLTLDPNRLVVRWKEQEVPLTIMEYKLLAALASRPGLVKSREALLELIHDHGEYVDDRSIDSHIKRIRQKIRDQAPDFDCIQTVYGLGYRYNLKETRWTASTVREPSSVQYAG